MVYTADEEVIHDMQRPNGQIAIHNPFNTDSQHSHPPVPTVPERKRRGIEEKSMIMVRPGRSVTPIYAVMLD